MDSIIKMIIDETLDAEIKEWLEKNSNGNKINTDEVYLGHTFLMDGTQDSSTEEYRILIDSCVTTAHNRFFIDVINRESIGIAYGWTGFAMVANSGRCVDEFEVFSSKLGKKVATLTELKDFIDKQNSELNEKKGNKSL